MRTHHCPPPRPKAPRMACRPQWAPGQCHPHSMALPLPLLTNRPALSGAPRPSLRAVDVLRSALRRRLRFLSWLLAVPPHPTPAAPRAPCARTQVPRQGSIPGSHEALAHTRSGRARGWAWSRVACRPAVPSFSAQGLKCAGAPGCGEAQGSGGPGRGTWGQGCSWGLQVSPCGPHSPGQGGGREGAFQAGKGRSRSVPDAGGQGAGSSARKRRAEVQSPSPPAYSSQPGALRPGGPAPSPFDRFL